jgi:hypothetical protein
MMIQPCIVCGEATEYKICQDCRRERIAHSDANIADVLDATS